MGQMVLPTVTEISHDRAIELQREWQRAVVAAEKAKAAAAKTSR